MKIWQSTLLCGFVISLVQTGTLYLLLRVLHRSFLLSALGATGVATLAGWVMTLFWFRSRRSIPSAG